MALATIFLAEDRDMVKFYTQDPVKTASELIARDAYRKIGTLQVEVDGEAAAEEMFDLSNNPSRQHERNIKWGANRSLSVGDVVHVDGESFLCASFGWKKL